MSNLFGSAQPWYGGYKYFGSGGYTILLKMKYGQSAPVQLPDEITKEQLDAVKHKFDIIEEHSGGGLFV